MNRITGSLFKYNPKVNELCLVADFKFYFNADKQAFELDQNPYGEPDLTTISNITSEENGSALKFDLCIVERKWHVFRSAIKNFSFETSDQLPIIKQALGMSFCKNFVIDWLDALSNTRRIHKKQPRRQDMGSNQRLSYDFLPSNRV